MIESVGKAYKPWLIASIALLVLSFILLAIDVTAVFLNFGGQTTPLWVIVLGVFAVLGVGLGFAGFFLLMAAAGWKAFREGRRVQVLTPDRHQDGDEQGDQKQS